MKHILTSRGKQVLIDDEDFDRINKLSWSITSQGYATAWNKGTGGLVLMHRVINNTPDGLVTDHVNGNKLDNRRANLRSVDRRANFLNSENPRAKNPIGVYNDRRALKKPWRVRLKIKGKQYHVGYYQTEREAIDERKKFLIKTLTD